MEIANSKNVNIEINQTPDTVINTEKTFGLKCPFSVFGFSKKNEYVPIIDKNYKFDPKTTIAILAGFTNKRKVMIFGNGGSAAIANHFSVDLTKNSKIRCVNFNESSLLTCFSNDFGYENWVKKTLEFHGNRKDMIILISSSGESKNMINACKFALKRKYFSIVTFTGFKKK